MRAIDGAIALGQELRRPVRLIWTANANLGCRFDDLFERPDVFADITERNGFSGLNIDWPKVRSFISLRSPPSVMCQADVERWLNPGADISWMRSRLGLHMKTHWRILNGYSGQSLFKPLPGLQDRIDDMLPIARECIGVHVRRGDHLPSRRHSPTGLFETTLDSELDASPRARFLVVSDDPEEEGRFKQRYGDAVVLNPKVSHDRACKAGVEDALVDLFTVAQTRRILGSAASSFSVMASDLGGAPLTIVSEELPEKLDWQG